jgi:uncharacterized membrane protein YphA (DoxX/SURF4 family)
MAPFDFHSWLTWLRLALASVWLLFGLVFKAFDAVPRHRKIVARLLGEKASRSLTLAIGAGEVGLGLWMISGRWLPVCVGIQTAIIVVMNSLEIRYARDLLLSPVAMVSANAVLLGLSWYVALADPGGGLGL